VLFGDVYICGGQSNMQFSMPAVENATEEMGKAASYPHLRLFTVGQGTGGKAAPLADLRTIEQAWSVSSPKALHGGGFGYFSAVCWFFGKQIADSLPGVPLGLISNNWGGTAVELWTPKAGFDECQRKTDGRSTGLYNAMVAPYTVGPMALTGFTWYQGEANTGSQASADAYACLFPAMIKQWRAAFKHPEAYFGFVQLSTWCGRPVAIAAMREAQMAALALPKVGYATNADHGAGCNIHPPPKQFCGERLGDSARALQYGQKVAWRSPTYAGATRQGEGAAVRVEFADVVGDLELRAPANAIRGLNCTKLGGMCAWASVEMDGAWVNATLSTQGKTLVLETPGHSAAPTATQYGFGSIPMMTVYDSATGLPVLPWSKTFAAQSLVV